MAADLPGTEPVRPSPIWTRIWRLPVWAHLAALGAILLLLVPVVGASQTFIADEGAAMIQAQSLAEGHGWIVENPLPAIDPGGAYYPIVNAEHGQKGFAPLAKHPGYALLAAAALRLGGVAGIVVLSLTGTVASAALAAALARRLDPALARPTVWAVGLGSPLLFDGFLAMGHTLGAALVTAAVLAAVVSIQDRRPTVAVLVAPFAAGAVLLRNEALLFALALALVAAITAVRSTGRRAPTLVAMAGFGGAAVAHFVERAWVAHITGAPVATTAVGLPAATRGFVGGRIDGFVMTWLRPTYNGSPLLVIALLTMVTGVAVCAARSRSHPHDRLGILGAGSLAAGAAIASLATAPSNIVPGLLVAFPLVPAGVLVMRRRMFQDDGAAVAGATAVLFALAVIATQYAVGGSAEWGGRYFALLLPVAVPLLLCALAVHGRSLETSVRRGAAAALVVCTVALSTMAVTGLRANHQAKARLVGRIEAAGRATGDIEPVVVTTWIAGARAAWPAFGGHRWLYVPTSQVASIGQRLRSAGVARFVFVTADLAHDRPQLGGLEVVSTLAPADGSGRQVLVVRTG